MNKQNLEELINKAKSQYNALSSILCPALGDEPVVFNKYGWNHLIRKGRKLRNPKEQLRRVSLIQTAIKIISTCKNVQMYKADFDGNTVVEFWELRLESVSVILRKRSNGKLHFFSVF